MRGSAQVMRQQTRRSAARCPSQSKAPAEAVTLPLLLSPATITFDVRAQLEGPAANVAVILLAAEKPTTPRHVAMSWAQRLKRVFGVDSEACARCCGKLKVIASIEKPQVIAKILAHLERTAPDHCQPELPLGARAPPAQSRLV